MADWFSLYEWQRDIFIIFSSRRRHTRWNCDWSSDVCSSDLTRRDRGGGDWRGQPCRWCRQRQWRGDRRGSGRGDRQRHRAFEHQYLCPAGHYRRRHSDRGQSGCPAQQTFRRKQLKERRFPPDGRRVNKIRLGGRAEVEERLMKTLIKTARAAMITMAMLAGTAAVAQDITIAVVPKVAVPFFDDCNTGAQAAADALGVGYQWVVPQNTQGATQVKIMEDLIARHVSGIAISVNEPKSVEGVIKQAMDAGIKVVTFDSDSAESGRSMYIGTINKQAGVTMGNSMAEKLGGKGKVAIITGQLGASNLNERIDGVKEALAAYPDIEIVAVEGTEDDLAKAVSVTEAILRGNPDLAGIFGMSQVGGPAVAKVLAQQEFADRKGAVAVFAFDDLPDTIQCVKDGYINGIMVQRPVTMGKLAVESLVAQIKGEMTAPADVDTGVTVVNADNLDSYTK